MDRRIGSAALAAVLFSFMLSACGGGGGSAAAQASGGGGASIEGVTTPSNVSVVTAKNAQ